MSRIASNLVVALVLAAPIADASETPLQGPNRILVLTDETGGSMEPAAAMLEKVAGMNALLEKPITDGRRRPVWRKRMMSK